MQFYTTFGLSICSDIDLPLVPAHNCAADIHIIQGRVPATIGPIIVDTPFYSLNEEQLLFRMPNIAEFLVESGSLVTYTLLDASDVDQRSIRLYLLGSIMGSVLHQRKLTVLHASAIQYGAEALLFTGKSGVGKSTMTASLAKQGFDFISDDISVLHRLDGAFYIAKGYPFSRLWDDSLDELAVSSQGLELTMKSRNKYIVPMPHANKELIPLRSIICLDVHPMYDLQFNRLSGGQCVDLIGKNIYRRRMAKAIFGEKGFFKQVVELAQCDVRELYRPYDAWRTNEIVTLLDNAYG